MREELLHFIWRFRHFNQQELWTEDGQRLHILFPGEPNSHQGPDFGHARIRIGENLCEGPVELHIHSSDWVRHAHDGDVHYQPVILHVVWEHDRHDLPGNIPLLVLQPRVSKWLLSRYDRWMKELAFVPCEPQLGSVDAPLWRDWLAELSLQRLRRRAVAVQRCLQHHRQDWEETAWWWLARSMGLPVNADLFEAVARSLPLRLLRRQRAYPVALEALLLGQAGLLGDGAGEAGSLRDGAGQEQEAHVREYRFLRVKYGLKPVEMPVSFLRMRPGNFPTLRLRQLAGLLAMGRGWYAVVREANTAEEVVAALAGPPGLGLAMRRGILVNAFIPLVFAGGQEEKALRWLAELPPENNTILRGWKALGVTAADAAGSQGLLELKKEYCNARRCLECAIGRALLAA